MASSDSPFGKLQGAFGTGQTKSQAIDYTHPMEEKLRHAAEKALEQSQTGMKLVRMAYQNNIAVRVLRHRAGQGFSPENRTVYLGIPAEIKEIGPSHVLELGSALRQAQQQILGFSAPGPDLDPVDFEGQYHAKNLDIIVTLCRICQELEDTSQDYVDSLSSMGHGEIYRAFVSKGSGDHLVDVYFEGLEKQKN